MNCTWQLLSTRTVQDAWRLTCGYRLAFSRRQWPQIQAKLANITGHPKCEAIRRLIRAHQRLEERHRPEQPSVVRAYTLGSACLSIAIATVHPQSYLPLVPVTGRRLLPSTHIRNLAGLCPALKIAGVRVCSSHSRTTNAQTSAGYYAPQGNDLFIRATWTSLLYEEKHSQYPS